MTEAEAECLRIDNEQLARALETFRRFTASLVQRGEQRREQIRLLQEDRASHLKLIAELQARCDEWRLACARVDTEKAQLANTSTLRSMQVNLPWTIHYARDFRASPMSHKDFGHALLHVSKAAGKLAALVNDAEHGGCEFKPEETDRYIADLVVCALRMANTIPGRHLDLETAVIERIKTKNAPAGAEPTAQECFKAEVERCR